MDELRGAIMHEQAYAQGKMLNHTGWRDILPRMITPSDCDMQFFDNNGRILLAEFSSRNTGWFELSKGQRMGYEALVKLGAGPRVRCIACLCKHSVPKENQINTLTDVKTFSVMIPAKCSAGVVCTFNPYPASIWNQFVSMWFSDPDELIRRVYSDIELKN